MSTSGNTLTPKHHDMSTSDNKLTLRSSDGETFVVDEAVASQSVTIKNMVEDVSSEEVIPLPNVDGKTLTKVIEYCKKHAKIPKSPVDPELEEEFKNFDAEFVNVDQKELYDLILAANYLNIKGLLNLTCQTVANMIKGKTADEIRKMLNIENDFSPEEQEEVRRENQWAFE